MTQHERIAGDPKDDLLVRMSKVPGIVAEITGERVALGSIYRWVQRGLRGQRLRTAYAGGHRRTCRRWLREFFAAVTAAAAKSEPDSRSGDPISHCRESEIADASEYLRKEGV